MSSSSRRNACLIALVILLGAGCWSGDYTGPTEPSPSGAAARDCRSLESRLPEKVEGRESLTYEPSSALTAAWGDPPIELRCGVPRPQVLSPRSEDYNPLADAVEVNGVSWLLEERSDGYRFTTTDRTAFVELTVPSEYAPEVGVLTDLADAISKSVPEKPL